MLKVVVIGGGPAGVTAALRARELGAQVVLLERGRLGGTCTNDGCVPTRVLAKAARLLRDARQFEEYGLVARPPALDFERLMSRVQQTIDQMHVKKQLTRRMEEDGIEVYAGIGDARFVDPHTVELPDGRQMTADRFILCAGGRARRMDFPGEELAITHSHVWWLKTLPRSVIILGAAATGCQLASIFAAFGTDVTLLEAMPRILPSEDSAISEMVHTSFAAQGIHIITKIQHVERIERADDILFLKYRTADGFYRLPAQSIILSTGWLGNLQSLNLPAAGVATSGNFVQVDDHLRTSAPHIFAAGDITGRVLLVQSASAEAVLAAENAVLGKSQLFDPRVIPHGGFTDPEYASVGLTEDQVQSSGLDYLASTVRYNEMDRAVIDGHTTGLCKLIVSRENHRLLGAHVAGEQALEIVHIAMTAMAGDLTIEQVAQLEIAYPTFAAIVGLAARRIAQALDLPRISPQWRALGYSPEAEWEKNFGIDARNALRND